MCSSDNFTMRFNNAVQSVYIPFRNASRRIVYVFDFFNGEWLLNKLRVRVQIKYPAIETTPLGDIHLGTLTRKGFEEKVVVKALRLGPGHTLPPKTVIRNLARECYMWSFLSHENICPFIGLDEHDEFKLPVLISVFIPNRCMEYVYEHPEDKLTVVRDVADGIRYLHDNGVVHGDVKPDNVMVDNKGRARITNFRASKLQSIIGLTPDQQEQRSPRFCAPELLRLALTQNVVKPTFQADVFGFAMTMLQILDGRDALSIPYNHYTSDFKLWSTLTESGASIERPQLKRYKNVPVTAHSLLQRCWEEVPTRRLSMAAVVAELSQFPEWD